MKSYYDRHGNLVEGTSIIQDILEDTKKTQQLLSVLKKFNLHIVTNAPVKDKKAIWIDND